MELDKIYNIDCLEGMKMIPDGSVDCIICDLPYGTMKGSGKWEKMGWEGNKHDWDEIIPTDKLFAEYGRILRRGGVAVLFSQEPYTSHLRTFGGRLIFLYPMYWKKNSAGNALNAKHAPLNFIEDINVFVGRQDSDADHSHPLRGYSAKLIEYIGKTYKEVQNDFIAWNIPHPTRVQHFLAPDTLQFYVCSAETYDLLIKHYGIDKMEGFREWQDLKDEENEYEARFRKVFNLPEGKASMSNVLEFSKDTDGFHPTQKPVALIRRLIQTYSNEGDTILDNCGGSGTTAIAAIREKRHFILFEKDPIYWKKSVKRVEQELRQLTFDF